MKQLPYELTAALDVTMPVGTVKRIEHQFKMDGSPCSTHKDSCLCVMRVEDGWFYKCHRCGMRGKVNMTQASPSQAKEIVSKVHMDTAPDSKYNGMYYNYRPTDSVPVFSLHSNYPADGVPKEAARWLLKNRIEYWLAHKYRVTWSPNYQRIIFPIMASTINDPLNKGWSSPYGWIGRSLSKEKTKDNPKWLKRIRVVSDVILYHAVGQYRMADAESICVLVEDAVSAIRVAEACGCHGVALLGTTLPKTALKRLDNMNVVVWLDADAYVKGLKMWTQLNKLGYMCRHLYTEGDPKTYSDEKIRQFIGI